MEGKKAWVLAGLIWVTAVVVQPASAQMHMTSQTSKNKKHFNLNFLKRSHHPHMQHQSDTPQRRKI